LLVGVALNLKLLLQRSHAKKFCGMPHMVITASDGTASANMERVMRSDSASQSRTDSQRDLPGFTILENLSTDDPHWRRTTLASVLLAATAATGARQTEGLTRLVLALAAVLCVLPALSLAVMIGIALLLRRFDEPHANGT
jgi:hypothetical protein